MLCCRHGGSSLTAWSSEHATIPRVVGFIWYCPFLHISPPFPWFLHTVFFWSSCPSNLPNLLWWILLLCWFFQMPSPPTIPHLASFYAVCWVINLHATQSYVFSSDLSGAPEPYTKLLPTELYSIILVAHVLNNQHVQNNLIFHPNMPEP